MSARELQRQLDCGVLWAPIAPFSYRSPLCDAVALSLSRGAVQFRAAQASACWSAITSMSCTDVADVAAGFRVSCPEILSGARPSGDLCRNPWECAEPERNTCPTLGLICEARCVARRGLHESCQVTADCVPGALCQHGCPPGVATCASPMGTCVMLVGEESSCGPAVAVCSAPFYCSDAGVCAVRRATGSCEESTRACSTGSSCRTLATGERACVPLKGPGDACQPSECLAALCGPDDSGGVCTQPPRIGDRCGYVLRELTVVRFLSCIEGWCDRPPGAPEGTCRARYRVGDPCVSGAECPTSPGIFCVLGVCQEVVCPE